MAVKGLVAAIVQFLTNQLEDGDITADSRESIEVAIQCLESAYNVQASDAPKNFDLLEVYKSVAGKDATDTSSSEDATAEAKGEAKNLKNQGNNLMKQGKFQEAISNYTKAIELDGKNAVYYCNRAAAYNKIGNYHQAINDCHTALALEPGYSKAYGRLGVAYSNMNKHQEAKESYQKALEMEPENESYKTNLQLAEEKLAQQGNTGAGGGSFPGMDLSSLLSNPALMNMAHQMLSDPGMQNVVSSLMTGNVEQGSRMDVLLEVGQQLANQMRNANPELIESLRRQMGGNPNEPDPSQNN